MPFKCELTLGDSLPAGASVEFVSWIRRAWDSESEWGKIVDAGTAYAVAAQDGVRGTIMTTFRVALMEQGGLVPGDEITRDAVLAIVAAEGDEIAYGKPYSVFVRDG